MDLVEMLSTIWRAKWLVLIVAVVAGSIVGFSSFRDEPAYQADSVLVVGNLSSGASLGRIGGEDLLAAAYAELVHNPVVLNRAAEDSQLSESELSSMVESVTETQSPYLTILATHAKPERAVEGANAISNALVGYLADFQKENAEETRQKILAELTDIETDMKEIQDNPVKDDSRQAALDDVRQALIRQYEQTISEGIEGGQLRIISEAKSTTLVPPHPWRNTSLAIAAGAFLGVAMGFVVDSVRRSLRYEE